MRILVFAAFWAALLSPAAARAEWVEASSDHFVIYANAGQREVNQFAQKLERYHSALALLAGKDVAQPSPSNRVTVYVLGNTSAVQKLYGEGSRYVGGFYLPRAGGSLAIVPRATDMFSQNGAMIVLLHEYAHHFLMSIDTMASPRWMSEGAAEFFAASSFEANGGMRMGRAAVHRAGELFYGRDVKAEDLLDPAAYEKRQNRSYDAFYGKSWLLYHYLTFAPQRRGQLQKYTLLLAGGTPQREAALEAFGDFDTLEKDLDHYLSNGRMNTFLIAPEGLKTGAIRLRTLSPAEAAIMPVTIRSRRGVDRTIAQQVVVQARAVAAKFPNDAAVLAALAEAEHDFGNEDAAVAAADAALAIDPRRVNAYVQKGFALFRKAADDPSPQAYREALAPFLALNKIENDHPLPLIYFYRSQVAQGHEPNALAMSGLRRASELAPFDLDLRLTLAMALFKLGQKDAAVAAIGPVAYNPHGRSLARAARGLMARAKEQPQWDGKDADALFAASLKEAAPDEDAAPPSADKPE